MRHLDLQVRFQTPGETGLIEGHAAIWDETNSFNEIMQRGVFTRSLRNYESTGTKVPMLWSHNPTEPIGVWDSIREDAKGLAVSGQIVLDTRRGLEAYSLLKAGAVDGLSIGFSGAKQTRRQNIKLVTRLDLREISLVAIPSSPTARVETVRSESGRNNHSAAALVNACRKASRLIKKGKQS